MADIYEDLLNHKSAVMDGSSRPRFSSELIGTGSHQANETTLVADLGEAEIKLLAANRADEPVTAELAEASAGFGTAFSLKRDYRSRYATGYALRLNGKKSSRVSAFISNVVKSYSEA